MTITDSLRGADLVPSAGRTVLAVAIGLFFGVFVMPLFGDEETIGKEYQFICENDGTGLSVVDVLRSTGDHTTFLAIRDAFSSLSDEELRAILGYHISPPRRAPGGSYPIVTPQFLIDAAQMNHRTRTGVLTKSDQSTQTSVTDGGLVIEDAQFMGTGW